MRPLSAHEILRIWEKGQNLHPLDRALMILRSAYSEMTWDRLSALPVVARDMMLFGLYEQTFGTTLKGFAECPGCRERLEFDISTKDILKNQEKMSDRSEYVLDMNDKGIELTYRLPTSLDLAAIADCEDVQSGRTLLAKRCILEAKKDRVQISENGLSTEVFDRLARRMEEKNPGADVIIKLLCPGCSHQWQMILDILVFLWSEISIHARRLLGEVHILAFVYKWSEKDILSMSPVRRRYYLDMVS
jgi:hypothetical protein